MPISLANLNDYPDLLCNIYEFLSIEEKLKVTVVCRTWKEVAEKAAKNGLILLFKASINGKARAFQSMVSGKLKDYSVKYAAELNNIQKNKESLSFNRLYKKLDRLVEYHTLYLKQFFEIDPNSPNIPQDKKK